MKARGKGGQSLTVCSTADKDDIIRRGTDTNGDGKDIWGNHLFNKEREEKGRKRKDKEIS